MRRLWLFLAVAGSVLAAEGRNIADYRIAARLFPETHVVEGHETLTWRNVSNDSIPELRLHLYMNAFRNKRSTFLREGDDGLRRLENNGWGWIDVRHIGIAGGEDLTRSMRYIHPDDDNADDQTVVSVPLTDPVPPGGSITLEIDFYTKLPHVVARAGYHGDFFMVTQWFPKMGVWEAVGDRRSTAGHWNCHQYHAWSEFYADYGQYDVTMTVPEGYVVGATGVQQSRVADAKTHTVAYRFAQDDVHDFAWTASPRFVRVERLFDPAREVTASELAATARLLGLPESDLSLKPVRMILLLQPENVSQIDRHFKALRTGLKYLGLWYGAYPYQTITLVDPPHGGYQAGGMEYPTFIAGWTRWLVGAHQQMPDGVILHEFAHQYWYGLVGSNEFEESWLDEGFTTYSSDKVLDLAYGPERLRFRVLSIPVERLLGLPLVWHDGLNRMGYIDDPKSDIMVRNAWQYYSSSSYGRNSYLRAGVMLRTLENLLGRQTMARVLRTYCQRWSYRHPTTLDFMDVVNEVSGHDMKWFFDEFVFGSDVVDYAVSEIKSVEAVGGKGYDSTVRIRRLGEAVLPVDLRVRFKDGSVVRRQWDGQYRWTEFKFTRPSPIESAEVDPDHKILLDVNFANNSRTKTLQVTPLAKWIENLVFWTQQLLLAAGGAG